VLRVIRPHHRRAGEDVALHGEVEVVEAETLWQIELGIERVDDEFVAVAAVGRRHAALA